MVEEAEKVFGGLMNELAAEQVTLQATRNDNGVWDVELRVGEGRSQVVSVVLTADEGRAVVILFSWVGPADAALYETALRTNAGMRYGRVAIVDFDDEPRFAVVNNALLEELVGSELMNAVIEVATQADALEEQFFGGDTE